jgi:cell division protein FtsN
MKPRKSQPAKKKSGGGTLIGMFIGLVLGVVAAAGVVWYMNKSPLPFNKTVQTPQQAKQEGMAANGNINGKAASQPAQPGQPLALPGKPGDPIPEKRFQFPDILSGKTDGTTPPAKSVEGTAAKPAPNAPAAAPEAPAGFYLMAGSFQKQSDAETQKANLALQGFDASIQKAVIGEKVWFRVKIGPFKRQDDANRARNELKEAGIDAVPARN